MIGWPKPKPGKVALMAWMRSNVTRQNLGTEGRPLRHVDRSGTIQENLMRTPLLSRRPRDRRLYLQAQEVTFYAALVELHWTRMLDSNLRLDGNSHAPAFNSLVVSHQIGF
jgi:hypothetical protein